MTHHVPDRRKEPRYPSSGRVEMTIPDLADDVIGGELIETSRNGFRIAHESNELSPGLEVALRHGATEYRVKVVWTHVLEGRRVSGFLVLSPPTEPIPSPR